MEGDKEFVTSRFEELKREIFGSDTTAVEKGPDVLKPGIKPALSDLASTSISEFVLKLGVQSHTDIVLGMAYYLLKAKAQDSFTAADLDHLYEEGRFPKSNVHLAIIGNIKKGLMMERSEKKDGLKAFAITASGERFVEELAIPVVGER